MAGLLGTRFEIQSCTDMELPQKLMADELVRHLRGILAFAHQYVDSPLSIKDPNRGNNLRQGDPEILAGP